jgi:hypothetical protein
MTMATKIILIGVLILVAFGSGCVYSTGGERIIKVADFPDEPEFQIEVKTQSDGKTDRVYVDAGYVWKQATFFWCPVSNKNGRYVGHVGSDTQYISLKPDEINALANKAGVVLPESPQLPFWDSTGGKLVGFVIAIILILSFIAKMLPNYRPGIKT